MHCCQITLVTRREFLSREWLVNFWNICWPESTHLQSHQDRGHQLQIVEKKSKEKTIGVMKDRTLPRGWELDHERLVREKRGQGNGQRWERKGKTTSSQKKNRRETRVGRRTEEALRVRPSRWSMRRSSEIIKGSKEKKLLSFMGLNLLPHKILIDYHWFVPRGSCLMWYSLPCRHCQPLRVISAAGAKRCDFFSFRGEKFLWLMNEPQV